MLFMFLLIMLIPYLGIGMLTERHRYAVEAHKYSQLESNHQTYEEAYFTAKTERGKLRHQSHCYLNYPLLKAQGCKNCNSETQYSNFTLSMKTAKSMMKEVQIPRTNVGVIVGWPVHGASIWLKSGTVEPSTLEISNETRILQLEKELEIR